MKRLVAAIVAIGLIVAASVVRRAIDDDDSKGGDASRGGRVVCVVELRDICDGLDGDVTIEDAAITAERLSAAGDALDVWVVYEPWPAIVDDARARNGRSPLFDDRTAVGRSQLVAVGPSSLTGCDWKCLGDGSHQLGSRPLEGGLGLVHLAAAANGWFGSSSFATNDFDPPFRSWLAGLRDAVKEDSSPVTRLLQSPAFFDAALSYEAEAGLALRDASEDRKARLTLLYPEPVAYLDVVVAGVDGAGGDAVDELPAALAVVGWEPPSESATGLPSAGVLTALRNELS